jgi:hypothetical protein
MNHFTFAWGIQVFLDDFIGNFEKNSCESFEGCEPNYLYIYIYEVVALQYLSGNLFQVFWFQNGQ